MIRVVRTFEAQPGKQQEVIETLKEISQYAATQDVNIQVFAEPWGHTRYVHVHTDFEGADTALGFLEELVSIPRAQESVQRLDELTAGHVQVALLKSQ